MFSRMTLGFTLLILLSFGFACGATPTSHSDLDTKDDVNTGQTSKHTALELCGDIGLLRRVLQRNSQGDAEAQFEPASLPLRRRAQQSEVPSSVVPYDGLADILIGMADPVPDRRTASLRTWNGTESDEQLVVTSGTMARAPHVMQITLLGPAAAAGDAQGAAAADFMGSDSGQPPQQAESDGAQLQWAWTAASRRLKPAAMGRASTSPAAMRRSRLLQRDAALEDAPVLHLMLPPLSEAADVFRTSMRGVPVRGVIVDGHAFVMAPEVTPQCCGQLESDETASADSSASVQSLACSIGGRSETFHTAADARQAVLQAVAEGAARAYDEQAIAQPLPLGLQRRLLRADGQFDGPALDIGGASAAASRSGSAAHNSSSQAESHHRGLYVAPGFSRGGRVILGVRTVFNGQQESATITDVDAATLLSTAAAELARSAMGAATFAYRVAPSVVTLPPSLPLCSSSYAAIESGVKAALTQLGIAAATYTHLAVLLPDCPPESIPWQGLGESCVLVHSRIVQ